jgi:hypothetical protein
LIIFGVIQSYQHIIVYVKYNITQEQSLINNNSCINVMDVKKILGSIWTLVLYSIFFIGILINDFLNHINEGIMCAKLGQVCRSYFQYVFNESFLKLMITFILLIVFIILYFKYKKR